MIAAGQNLYRIYFKYKFDDFKDREFNKLVVAHSDKEAESHLKKDTVVVKTQLVEEDVSIIIPDQYLNTSQ